MAKSTLPHPFRSIAAAARAILLTLLLLSGTTWADPAPRAGYLMWQIGTPDKPVMLLGSLHIARPDFYPLPTAYLTAYEQSEALVVEADVSDPAKLAEMLQLMTYAPPDGLDRHVRADTWKALQDLADTGKVPPDRLRVFRPDILASVITFGAAARHGFSAESGIDLYFLRRARDQGKQVIELESLRFQAELMRAFPDEDGDAMLMQSIEAIRTGEALQVLDDMAAAWQSGDVAALSRIMEEQNQDPLTRRMNAMLLDQRNVGMADRIAALVGSKSAFVVVGAAHLLGQNSILELLQARGIAVHRVDPEATDAR